MEGQLLGIRAPGIMSAEMIMDQILRGGDDNLMSFNESVGVGKSPKKQIAKMFG